MTRIAIERIEATLVGELRYLNAAPRGGTTTARLPLARARLAADAWTAGELDAIVACSDLQGVVRGRGDASQLLGVAVAEWLDELADDGVLPPVARTGVILAGDLYSVPGADKRGGFGDVRDVWAAFAERFAWVAGVSGNHDDVSRVRGIADNAHLLDGEVALLDGVRIGGVGGIVGNPEKRCRRSEEDFLHALDGVIDRGADIVVLHEGPHGADDHQRGNAAIRATLEAGEVPFTICGHAHWSDPLARIEATGQILNVDARVVVLLR